MVKLADLEWIAALAYPVAILLSGLFARKEVTPTVSPATISDLKDQILANARLLLCSTPKAKKGYIDSERLIIAIVIEPPTDTRPPRGLITKAAIKPAIRAIILDTHHDEDSGDRVALTGPPRNSFGEALESLLLVAATKLSGQIGDVSGCGIEDEDVQNGAEGKER